jgi:methionyl-tRNA formyltransferase
MSSNLFRFAYFGLPLGALALARAGFVPRVIVLGHTDAPGARRVQRQLGSTARVLGRPDLADPEVVSAIASARPEALLSWFYPKQIPEPVLRLAARGAFGAHPSLLPRWRGPDPYFWALYAGDERTGVSLHRLEAEYDTGAVIAQESVTIGPDENAWRLAKRLDRPGLALLVRCAAALSAGEALLGSPQDEALATPAPAPDEALLSIDWSKPVAEIVRLVRAAAPYPGAGTELGEEPVELLEARRYEGSLPRALQPRDAVWTPAGLVVTAGDGGVVVSRVRDADGLVRRGAELTALFTGPLARVGFNRAERPQR